MPLLNSTFPNITLLRPSRKALATARLFPESDWRPASFDRESPGHGILPCMSEPTHWAYLIALSIKLLAKFGLIPGFFAAFGIQKLRQKYRQRRAVEGWPSTVANIQWCKVHQEGMRNYWVEVTYSYFVGEYRSGTYIRRFTKEAHADDFASLLRDKQLQVHYKPDDPSDSVFLERDLEMVAALTPELR